LITAVAGAQGILKFTQTGFLFFLDLIRPVKIELVNTPIDL
jgi:hypothetical protein